MNLFAILLAALATHGVSVTLPSGWQAAPRTLTPQLIDPKERFSVGTYRLRYRKVGCSQFPSSALADMGPRDAFVTLQERRNRRLRFPPRPAHFGPRSRDGSEAVECVPRARFSAHWQMFRDHGRNFYVLVVFGRRASAARRRQAWAILDGLRVTPAALAAVPRRER